MLRIRPYVYRKKAGFTLSGTDVFGNDVNIFSSNRDELIVIREVLNGKLKLSRKRAYDLVGEKLRG